MNGRPFTEGELRTVEKMAFDGFSVSQIARHLDRNTESVRARVRKMMGDVECNISIAQMSERFAADTQAAGIRFV